MQHDLNWELRLGFLVHDVGRMRRNVVDRSLRPLGITRSQWWVLAFLSRRDGLSQVALADELDIGKVALGALVDRLETGGLIQRQADLVDRRIKRVYLSKSGTKLVKDIRSNVSDLEKSILNGIDDFDLQVAGRALRGMKENLRIMLGGDKMDEASDDDVFGMP